MKSPVTNVDGEFAFHKGGYDYYRDNLGNLYCGKINQADMVGGGFEVERNNPEDNNTRIQRIKALTAKTNPKVLDFGCGNGLLVKDMLAAGVEAEGYDEFNPEFKNIGFGYDAVTMVEVIEHLYEPFDELWLIRDVLNARGVVMIETSFTDWLKDDAPYIEPKVGHGMIFSHAGLDHLMVSKGFRVGNHINDNVRIYTK